ncbi:response regulator [Stenomitos frigidus]|uniref:DNA-binding response regulator n=1 Tax=Stenomitos frigidus ULC18 TaxID=2107698 RepID=A0A2T1DSZ9_9CYAN|nr:response regulator transcription factor [Stenomitos frigidus]PSB23600.1 DNA-binding response regulator [Stenomitos frigidus ULC18]
MIRLLLVDDQDLIRRGMKALLKSDDTLQVVGEAANGQDAIALVAALTPDVVLMDVRMPVMDGVAATQAICQQFPGTKVLVLTTFDDQEYVTQALQKGASGYLLKDTPFEELVQAIRFVQKGYTQIGPGLSHKAIAAPPVPPNPPLELTDLTPREQEILQLIAQGSSNREIAQVLFISEKTVRNHVTNILSRLGLRDRTQAAIVALQKHRLN